MFHSTTQTVQIGSCCLIWDYASRLFVVRADLKRCKSALDWFKPFPPPFLPSSPCTNASFPPQIFVVYIFAPTEHNDKGLHITESRAPETRILMFDANLVIVIQMNMLRRSESIECTPIFTLRWFETFQNHERRGNVCSFLPPDLSVSLDQVE